MRPPKSPDDREASIARQTPSSRHIVALAPDAVVEWQHFMELALAAQKFDPEGQGGMPYSPYGETFRGFVERADKAPGSVPPEVVAAWRGWEGIWADMIARHPRLALYDLMWELSEIVFAMSWPTGHEGALQDWADQESPVPPPRFLRGVDGADWHARLRALRQQLDGWLHLGADGVVFAPEGEWQQLRAAHAAEQAAREASDRDRRAWQAERQRHVDRVFAAARKDPATWESLRRWEMTQEQIDPDQALKDLNAALRRSSGTPGTLTLRPAMKEEMEEQDRSVHLDPIFQRLLDDCAEVGRTLPVRDIVLNLRSRLRAELGLPSIFVHRWHKDASGGGTEAS